MTRIYTSYVETWESMLEDCRSAREHIYFEQFILQDFGEEKIGTRFLEVFKQKVAEGVTVKLIIDAVGSIGLTANAALQNEIRQAGIELEFFGLVPRWKATFPFSLFHRDHRKVLVVDDRIARVGGIIISDRSKDWIDVDVRVTDGRYVSEVAGAFLKIWDEVRGSKEHRAEYDLNTGLVLRSDPEHNELYKEILSRVRKAKTSVTIVTPYFSPDWKMVRALKKARKRGVWVELIVPEQCDSKLTYTVTQSYMWQLFRYKIDVYRYRTCMNHGKMVLVDDWVTVGSMNFDRLSFFWNRELNLALERNAADFDGFVSGLKTQSTKVDKAYFKRGGIKLAIESFVGKIFRPIA